MQQPQEQGRMYNCCYEPYTVYKVHIYKVYTYTLYKVYIYKGYTAYNMNHLVPLKTFSQWNKKLPLNKKATIQCVIDVEITVKRNNTSISDSTIDVITEYELVGVRNIILLLTIK